MTFVTRQVQNSLAWMAGGQVLSFILVVGEAALAADLIRGFILKLLLPMRLSIMSLRLYHYQEQLDREDTDEAHKQKVSDRIALCQQQHTDLSNSLQQLLNDQFAGRKQHKTYRQMKMYNDEALNPVLYQSKK